jgi:hypothetical protein
MHELSSSKMKQGNHMETTMTDRPPRSPDDKGPVDISDSELIFSVSTSAIEATHNSLQRDCQSLGLTTCSDSSISSDGEMTNRRRGSSSTSTRSPGGPANRVHQVREYERNDAERKQPSTTHSGTPIQSNNLNKKRRTLKKNIPMVGHCIRAAKCCRKLMKRVLIGKRTDGKATKDYGGTIAKGKALECVQKKPLESLTRHLFSSEEELKVSVAVREESCETDRKEEDASAPGLIDSSAWTSIDSDEGMKEDDQQPVSPEIKSVNDIHCVSSVVTESDEEDECLDQQATSLVSKSVKVVNPGRQGSPDRKQMEQGTPDTLSVSRQVTIDERSISLSRNALCGGGITSITLSRQLARARARENRNQ